MLRYYKGAGDEKTVKKLEATHFTTMDYMPDDYNKIRDDVMHRAGIGTTHKMKSVITGIFMPVMQNREYILAEKINIWRGKAFSNSTDLNDDYTVNYSLAEAYLKKLSAPVKGFYLFKESAHSPIFEEPKKVIEIMQNDVLKGKNDLADTY